jgi:two-component system, chemotaxis family, response regulator Rcp1
MTNKPQAVEVLLIDDSDFDAELILEAARESKLRNSIRHVASASAGLAYLRAEPPYEERRRPNLVLLDLNMPGMSGHEFLEEVRGDPQLQGFPVVILTSSKHEADVAKSYAEGASAYVVKPVGLDGFADIVAGVESFWFSVVEYGSGQSGPEAD